MKIAKTDRRNKRDIQKAVLVALIIGLFLCAFAPSAEPRDGSGEGVLLEVKTNMIALPGNKVARVPLSGARVRSDELKEINAMYGAVTIERMYVEVKEKAAPALGSMEKTVKAGGVPLGSILTKENRRKLEEEGKAVEKLNDVYLIRFVPGADLLSAVDDYKALDVVVDAQKVKVNEAE